MYSIALAAAVLRNAGSLRDRNIGVGSVMQAIAGSQA